MPVSLLSWSHMTVVKLILIAMRPQQWVKNIFVFSAPIAAESIFNFDVFKDSFIVFLIFICASASVYLVNDFFDRESDSLHPKKSSRPLASGDLSAQTALLVSILTASTALTSAFIYGFQIGLILLVYLIINFLYSSFFKRITYMELVLVGSGFSLRAIAGGLSTETELTFVFVFVVSAFALFLVSCKRYSELVSYPASMHRYSLTKYSKRSLTLAMAMFSSSGIIAYVFWVLKSENGFLLLMIVSCVILLLGTVRVYFLALKGRSEDPSMLIASDPLLTLITIFWLASFFGAVYV